MKIGITIEPYEGIPARILLSFAKTISLDHIEINVNIMPDIEGFITKIGKLTTTFHLPIAEVEGYDPGVKNPNFRNKMSEVISFINKYHNDLNMLYTLAHPPDPKDSDFELFIESLQQIQTSIVLENIPWQKDKEFIEFYNKAKDRLGKQLAGHAIDGPHRYLTNPENWLDVPKILENEIVYVHLQDTNKDFDAHLPLGQGEMPHRDFLRYLKKINYQGVINQEIKPKGLDLESIMDSCLEIAKVDSKTKYLRLRARYAILRPILQKKIAKAVKNKVVVK
ncbi:MAG: sugar phosphate isomerase/epimerase [Candidatus Heimdallarchaeota archaeon]|nr:sugar phosphate isomerase/epimerase [Candidatus Heimdallarchaeota archaeon]